MADAITRPIAARLREIADGCGVRVEDAARMARRGEFVLLRDGVGKIDVAFAAQWPLGLYEYRAGIASIDPPGH